MFTMYIAHGSLAPRGAFGVFTEFMRKFSCATPTVEELP